MSYSDWCEEFKDDLIQGFLDEHYEDFEHYKGREFDDWMEEQRENQIKFTQFQ